MRRLIATALPVLALALAGCGGDDDGGNEQPAPELAPPKTAAQTVDVTETDFKLDPANPTIDEPGDVVFKVSNDGDVEHSLEVEGPNGEAKLDRSLAPGDSGRLEVKLDKAGRYEWYCPIGNHRELGMEGEVTVGGGGSTKREDKSQSDDSGGGSAATPEDQSQSGNSGSGGGTPQGGTGSPSTGGSGGGGGGSGGDGGGTQPEGGSGSPSTGGSGY
jgi:plastocyanin